MIDILIPAYNCSKTIGRTLASLVSQLDQDFKIYIRNDGSTENIYGAIKPFMRFLDICYLDDRNNIGVGLSRQYLIDHSKNRYFMFLDADDVLMPNTIQLFNRCLKKHPNCGGIASSFYRETDGGALKIGITDGGTWCHGKVYDRLIFNKLGLKFHPNIKYSEDVYANGIYFEFVSPAGIDIPTMIWTNNGDSITRSKDSDFADIKWTEHIKSCIEVVKFVSKYKKIEDMKFLANQIPYIEEHATEFKKGSKEAIIAEQFFNIARIKNEKSI